MNNTHSITLHTIKYILLILLVLGAKPSLADELYVVEPYIDFSTQDLKIKSWLPPVANTKNSNEIFFTNTNGSIYRAEGQKIENVPFIDLSEQLETKSEVIFTSIAFHPSFHLLDQEGFNVIYTSHIEAFEPSPKRTRLGNKELNERHTHDAVIVEWQLSNIDKGARIIKQREVLRIATSSIDINVNQLSFNPYLKPWSDDYGLLYIGLKPDDTLQQSSLYAGSILRINPAKFGLKNYTVPTSNPFIKDTEIEDEILIVGAQNIQQFTWSKKANKKLILNHTYNDKQLISITPSGSNYLLKEPSSIAYEQAINNNTLSAVYYRGREFSTLWNKILFIEKSGEEWEFKATDILNKEKAALATETVLTLDVNKVGNPERLSLYLPRENQMLIWDQDQFMVYKLLLNSPINNNTDLPQKETQSSSSNTWLYIFIILIVVAVFVYFKSNYGKDFIKNKSLLRANFARFEFDLKGNEVQLFKRHETEVNTTLSSLDITSSEIYLNNVLINQVSSEANNIFNEQKENALRLAFEQEHRDKMVDDKVRQITLKVTTLKGAQYHICAYLREGNQRLTKAKYHSVIDDVIDWHWYFSSIINPDETPVRPIKETPKPLKAVQVVKPSIATNKDKVDSSQSTTETRSSKEASVVAASAAETDNKKPEQASASTVDTKLIEALNKLVQLKEEGHLTEDEFAVAKNNLLNSLSNNQ